MDSVPVTVITGFLGVGKTTAVRHLLSGAPAGERWAVLVNEFGEVGIDGALLGGGLAVREVRGGCICCAAGLPLRVAIVRLLREIRPSRLLVEPSGLAKPASVVDLLRAPGLGQAVAPRAVITLVDAERLLDPKYRDDETFEAQLQVADVIVVHRADLSTPQRVDAAVQTVAARFPPPRVIAVASRGELDPAWLDLDPTVPDRVVHRAGLPGALDAATGAPLQPFGRWAVELPRLRVFDRRAAEDLVHELVRPGVLGPGGRLRAVLRTPGLWLHVDAGPDAVTWRPCGHRRGSVIALEAEVSTAREARLLERIDAAMR